MKKTDRRGGGPGDPELITVKALRVLREADAVFVPVMAGPDGAPQVAGAGRGDDPRPHRPGADPPGRLRAERHRRGHARAGPSAWQAAARRWPATFGAGASTVAFGTIGDPNLYSTFSYLAQTVRDMVRDVLIETVPGITAMQDLAARSATVTGTAAPSWPRGTSR